MTSLRLQVQRVFPKPAMLHSFSLAADVKEAEHALLSDPEESFDFGILSFALLEFPFEESAWFLPISAEYCAAMKDGCSELSGDVILFVNSRRNELRKHGLYAACLRSLELIFLSWTSSFARLAHYDCRASVSCVHGYEDVDDFLDKVLSSDLEMNAKSLFECLFWLWIGDDRPERNAHLLDFLYRAAMKGHVIDRSCRHEPSVMRLATDVVFCRTRFEACSELFRAVTGEEYTEKVRRMLLRE